MKTIKTFVAMFAMALMIGVSACTEKNPAQEFVTSLENLTKQADAVTSISGFAEMQSAVLAADQFVKDHADYELTDSDKEAIKSAMKEFLTVSYSKSFSLSGHQVSAEQLETMVDAIVAGISNAKTLGELGNPIEQENETVEEEIPALDPDNTEIEEAIEETAAEIGAE